MAKAKAKKKPVAKKKPAKKSPAKKQLAAKKPAKKPPAKKPKREPTVMTLGEKLGSITVPSGKLAVFDVGLVGYLPRPALEPALVTADVPADRELAVIGTRVGTGRFADCWDHVAVKLAAGQPTHWKKLGEAGVDFARLICMDHAVLDQWTHEDTLDGLADVVFWGRDAVAAAKASGAKSLKGEGYGWTNLSLDVAEEKALEVDKLKAANQWGLMIDFRPHSHHFYALAEARKSKHGAGTIEVGDAKVCLFFTSWGDGVFPIFLDLDEENRPLQIRVQLNTQSSLAAMHAVNS